MAAVANGSRRGFTLIWKIENAGLLEVAEPFWSIQSPVFTPRSLGEKRFRLYLNLRGDDGEGEYMKLLLFQRDEPLDFPKDFEWSFIDSNGSPFFGGTVQNHVMHAMERIDLPGCPTFDEVFVTRKSEFLPHDTLTLRICIWKSGGDLPHDEFVHCRSRYELVKDSFVWPISKFTSLELDQEVTTPVKFEFSNGSCELQLKFALKGVSLEEASVNVEIAAAGVSTELLIFSDISVLDHQQKRLKCVENAREYFVTDSKESSVLPEIVSRKELQRKKSDYLRNDVLTLFCEFTAIGDCSHSFERKNYGPSNLTKNSLKDYSTSI